jgi:hypothetical protein
MCAFFRLQVAVIELDYVEDAMALRAEEFEAVSHAYSTRHTCYPSYRGEE